MVALPAPSLHTLAAPQSSVLPNIQRPKSSGRWGIQKGNADRMLFLVISEPRLGPPSSVTGQRKRYWDWIAPMQASGEVRSTTLRLPTMRRFILYIAMSA